MLYHFTLGNRLYLFVAIFIFLFIGTYALVGAQSPSNVIHACVSRPGSASQAKNIVGDANTGSVRIIQSESDCRNDEYYISWNDGYSFQAQIYLLETRIDEMQSQLEQLSNQSPNSWIQVDAGGVHTCLLRSTGLPLCLGVNWWGSVNVPVNEYFSQLSVDNDSSSACGLKTNGTLECWGGEVNGIVSPVDLNLVQISTGWRHVCGLSDIGNVYCWGRGVEEFDIPVPVNEVFMQIESGSRHACGLRNDGTVSCWGIDLNGETVPPSGEIFSEISAGTNLTCGLANNGGIFCWGDNYGSGAEVAPTNNDFISVATSGYVTCGVNSSGFAQCWGTNDYGESNPPIDVVFTRVSVSQYHGCGLSENGTVYCWGDNTYGHAPYFLP